MIKPIDKKSLYEEITDEIIRQVKNGLWKPGEKITGELALAEAFGVSRNSIRESLKALELSGLIISRPGRGTFLSENAFTYINRMELVETIRGTKSYDKLMETRLIIEPELAYLAAQRATKEDIRDIEELLIEQKQALAEGNYNVTLGLKFHMRIMESSKNDILFKFMGSIADELCASRFTRISSYFDGETLSNELDEHKEILNYIKLKEADIVREKVYNHIKNAKDILRDMES